MNHPSKDQIAKKKERFTHMATRPWSFALYLLRYIPVALFSGIRIRGLTEEECMVSVPYSWFSRNPFRSTYFACLAMAGEMSTGALAMLHVCGAERNLSMLVTGIEAQYHKKARGLTRFICKDGRLLQAAVQYSQNRSQPQTCKAYAVGINPEGECVAEFWITWSFKLKE
ncbi:MAG TPA: DUF4442 domain-containing protein [Dinghuibacter sp.]|jgi:hypothetical protein|uniref:DUF4442 domain-containing protein n=1 Tax=Dinghuibacter sp. TaxID=2024697 RepID=UPI002BE238C4|nr:DUF4442 domain-containing protein [Dinghuibacter sp.]HTJ12430.1 DUF4442 domain-containing protein [Dinghuibacter sp.]